MMINTFSKHLQYQDYNSLIDNIGWYLGYDGRANQLQTTGLYAPFMGDLFFELPPGNTVFREYNAVAAPLPDGELRIKLTFFIGRNFSQELPGEGLIVNEMGIGFGPTDLISRVVIEGADGSAAGVQLSTNDYLYTKFNLRFKFSQSPTINPVIVNSTNHGGRLIFFKDTPIRFSQPLLEPCGVDGPAIIPTNAVITQAPSTMYKLPSSNITETHSPHANDYYSTRGFSLGFQEGNIPGGISAIYLRAGRTGSPCAVLALDTPIPKTNLLKLNMPKLINTRWSMNNVS